MRQLLIVILFFFIFSACKKEIPEPPTSSSSNGFGQASYSQYNVTFFTFSTAQGPIGVSCGGSSGSITYALNYYPGCNEFGCANMTIPPGTHTWVAAGATATWQGTIVTGSSQCITVRVQ